MRGFSLIELMVTLVIALVMSLAIFATLSTSRARERTVTSVSDLLQAGNFAMYVIGRQVRSAGSGFRQAADHAFGCRLHAARATGGTATAVLPRGGNALPAPFASLNPTGTAGDFRLAPLIVVPGGSGASESSKPSDALIVMSGAAGLAEVPIEFLKTVPSTGSSLQLVNTRAFRGGDLVLVTEAQGGAAAPCMVQQVRSGFVGSAATQLPLDGSHAAPTIAALSLTDFTMNRGRASNLGNVAAADAGADARGAPRFMVMGVGDGSTLYGYDLLQLSAAERDAQGTTPAIPLADSVFELHALYGIDNNADGIVDAWVKPDSADYAPAALLDGSAAARARLRSIVAVRIGLIMKSPLAEKTGSAAKADDAAALALPPPKLVLFEDLGTGLAYQRDELTPAQKRFRYRTLESTIPLRNPLL